MLAMVRLIHGGALSGVGFSPRAVKPALITALMHDTGYIQTVNDPTGTGAKYTRTHVERSVRFMEEYLRGKQYSTQDVAFCAAVLRCTGVGVKIQNISFLSEENKVLGWMLGTADLLGQMADRTYLERLPFLYREFVEGGVDGFESEPDFLQKTPGFVDMTLRRFQNELGGVYKYGRDHFRVRWGIDEDLYSRTIERTVQYLRYLLVTHPHDYRRYLRRKGFMKKIESLEHERDGSVHVP